MANQKNDEKQKGITEKKSEPGMSSVERQIDEYESRACLAEARVKYAEAKEREIKSYGSLLMATIGVGVTLKPYVALAWEKAKPRVAHGWKVTRDKVTGLYQSAKEHSPIWIERKTKVADGNVKAITERQASETLEVNKNAKPVIPVQNPSTPTLTVYDGEKSNVKTNHILDRGTISVTAGITAV